MISSLEVVVDVVVVVVVVASDVVVVVVGVSVVVVVVVVVVEAIVDVIPLKSSPDPSAESESSIKNVSSSFPKALVDDVGSLNDLVGEAEDVDSVVVAKYE